MDDEMIVRAAIRDEVSAPLEDIREELRRVGRQAEQTDRQTSRAARGFDTLARSAGGVAKRGLQAGTVALAASAAGLVYATGKAVTFGVSTAAAMQTAKIGFTTMLGSGKKANAFLRDLSAFAAKTPFEFPELQTAASSLISAGINADKVIPIMTTLGNVTSGMGTGSEGVQRATVALQQMSAAGRITGEDLNQLRDAGIPVYDLLASATGKSKAEVVALAQAGKLGATELGQMMSALETGKGLERFSGLMDKQSESLSGVASTFKDTLGMGLAKALQPAIPLMTKATLAGSDLVAKGIDPVSNGIEWLIDKGVELHKSGDIQRWASTARDEAVRLWESVQPLVSELFELGRDALPGVAKGLGAGVRLFETVVPLVGQLVGMFNDLPGSAKKAMLLGAAIYFLAGKLGDVRTRGTEAMERLRGVDKRMMAMRTTAGLAGGAMLTYAGDVGKSHQSLGDLMTIGGSIATGFAAGGPIGAALGGLGGVFAVFTGHSKAAAEAQERLDAAGRAVAATLDAQTGALGENTIATAAKQLADSGAFDAGKKIGVAYQTVLDAAMGNAAAQREVNAATGKYIAAADGDFDKLQKRAKVAQTLTGATNSTADAIDKERRSIEQANAAMGKTPKRIETTFDVNTEAGQAKLDKLNRSIARAVRRGDAVPSQTAGDTATSRARGRGGLASTLHAHNMAASATGAKLRVTNALVGGGGHGRGSGDHQAGRALDVQGSGLGRYGKYMRDAGGFAEMHGHGAGRHLHVVPPAMGDTASSKAASVSSRSSSGGGSGRGTAPVIIGPGAIIVQNPSSTVDLEQGVADGIDRFLRDQEERS